LGFRGRIARALGLDGRAISVVLVAGALAVLAGDAARAASTVMTVDWVREEEYDREYYAGSPSGTAPVDALNSTSVLQSVEIDQWPDEWWETRFTDPHPGTIPNGGFLISVIVTVQYEMRDPDWNGTLTLEARSGTTLLGTTSLPERGSATQETWDVTALLNAEADPLAALNDLGVRMVNDDLPNQVRIDWSHARVDVVYGGPPAGLAFAVGPGDTAAGEAFAPALKVIVLDAYGNTVPHATDDVTLAIAANPGSGTLSGTTTVAAAGGVATFSDLSIDRAAGGYTLEATSGSLTSATSVEFEITPGAPTGLAFIAEPSSAQMGNAIAPPVRVAIVDDGGNAVTSAWGNVAISILNNPGGGTLSGTTSVDTVNGVANFIDLSIDLAGDGYTLEATSAGLASTTSAAFDVVPEPLTTMTVNWARDNLGGLDYYAGSPNGTVPMDALNSVSEVDKVDVTPGTTAWWETRYTDPSPAPVPADGFLISVVVTVQYVMEHVDWDGTLALEARTGAALLGSTTLPEHSTPTQETWDVTALLNAEADPLASLNDLAVRMVNDDPLGVKNVHWSFTKVEVTYGGPPQKVVFAADPADTIAGAAFSPAIQVVVHDVYGNTVPDAADSVTVAIAANPGGGALGGTTTVAASAGVATFTDLNVDEAGSGYALVAWAPGLVSAMTGTFDVLVPPPEGFDLVSPAHGEPYAALAPQLEWGSSAFAETYALLVAEDASFLSIVVDEASLTGTTHAVPAGVLQSETVYFWKVTASNSTADTGASNNDFSFTTRPRPLLSVTPSGVSFAARSGSTELVRRDVIVTNSGSAGSVAEVTVAWSAPPGCDIAISEASFTLAAGESRAVTLSLDPSSSSSGSHVDAFLDISAKAAAGATDPVLVTVDLEPYGAAGIGCAARGEAGREEEWRPASFILLALILAAARSLIARRRGVDAGDA
jgi:hypothetical protein